jgi:hypothetical protein
MTRRDLARREFLKSMRLGLCALPFIAEESSAAPLAPKRLVTVMQSGGTIHRAFWPTGTGSDLTQYAFPEITAPLKPHAASLTFVQGLWQRNFLDNFPPFGPDKGQCGNNRCSHGGAHDSYASLFSSRLPRVTYVGEPRGFMESHPTGPSIDQFVGRQIAAAGGPNPLVVGVVMNKQGGRVTQRNCFYAAQNAPQTPQDDTRKLFDTYFANRGPQDATMERLRLEKRSILDSVGTDLELFAQRAGKSYREKVEAHLTGVRDLEKVLAAPAVGATCSQPTIPSFNPSDLGQYDRAMEAQLRFVAAALACDAVRSVAIQLTNGESYDIVFHWLGIAGQGQEFGVRSFHDVQHRTGANDADKIRIDQWFMKQMAFFLDRLTEVKEPGGTVLDNSLVIWGNHMSIGGAHNSDNMPWVMAGRCGGAIKAGQFIRVPNQSSTSLVLNAACLAMGVQPDRTFADQRYSEALTSWLA